MCNIEQLLCTVSIFVYPYMELLQVHVCLHHRNYFNHITHHINMLRTVCLTMQLCCQLPLFILRVAQKRVGSVSIRLYTTWNSETSH